MLVGPRQVKCVAATTAGGGGGDSEVYVCLVDTIFLGESPSLGSEKQGLSFRANAGFFTKPIYIQSAADGFDLRRIEEALPCRLHQPRFFFFRLFVK